MTFTHDARPHRQQGFALLLVLWSLGLLALLASVLGTAGRNETRLAAALRASAMAEAAADGAVQEAALRLLQGLWAPDGGLHRLRIGTTPVEVRLEDQAGKFNPNVIAQPRLQALLRAAGANPPTALMLSARLTDWRTAGPDSLVGGPKPDAYRAAHLPYGPPNRPFADPDELGLVLGMTPDLLARLKPLISLYNEGQVGQAASGDLAGQVLAEARLTPTAIDGLDLTTPDKVVLVRAAAARADAVRFERRAMVRIKTDRISGRMTVQVLTWEDGPS